MSSTRYEMDVFCNAMSLVPHDAGSLGSWLSKRYSRMVNPGVATSTMLGEAGGGSR